MKKLILTIIMLGAGVTCQSMHSMGSRYKTGWPVQVRLYNLIKATPQVLVTSASLLPHKDIIFKDKKIYEDHIKYSIQPHKYYSIELFPEHKQLKIITDWSLTAEYILKNAAFLTFKKKILEKSFHDLHIPTAFIKYDKEANRLYLKVDSDKEKIYFGTSSLQNK